MPIRMLARISLRWTVSTDKSFASCAKRRKELVDIIKILDYSNSGNDPIRIIGILILA